MFEKGVEVALLDKAILDELYKMFRENMIAVAETHKDEPMEKIVYSQLYVNIKAILDHGPKDVDFLYVVESILATANKAFLDSGAGKVVDINKVEVH